ncbi:MAG: universal stress protein [Pirellulaceae bacterium]
MLTFRTILHPTDFSDHAAYALDLATSFAQEPGARLIVLHVMQPWVAGYGGIMTPPPSPEDYRQGAEEQLREIRVAGAEELIEHRLEEGTPAEEILRVAKEIKCDLIVMGTHGRTGMQRLLTGGVAEKVMRQAPCPVLIVKTPIPEAAPNEPVTVLTLNDPMRAELIKNALQREDISCALAGIQQATAVGLPGTIILVQVPATSADRARELLETWEDASESDTQPTPP